MKKFQRLTEFERESIIGLPELELSYLGTAAHMQLNSSTVKRV